MKQVLCVALLAMLLSAAVVYGQAVSATLLGNVTDVSGAVVPNAKVTITEQNTNVSRSAETNESGNYTFPDLPPGEYSVSRGNHRLQEGDAQGHRRDREHRHAY